MSEIKFHRITDCNGSIDGLNKQTSFEAGFSMSEEGGLFLQGRVIDSEGVEIFGNSDLRERAIDRYQNWNPEANLEKFINVVELQTSKIEVGLETPDFLMRIEVKGPVARPEEFGTTIYMAQPFTVLSRYEWRDTGQICVWMLCKRDNLLAFARGLQGDLRELRSG